MNEAPLLPTIMAFGEGPCGNVSVIDGVDESFAKSPQFDELETRLKKLAAARSKREETTLICKNGVSQRSYCGMLGASPKMRRIFELIERFANNPSNILIEGETGTGKEQVARALHLRSLKAKCPFVTVDCANVPRELAESELFGHEVGAFTGATRRRKGRIEMAQGGTLFLDDVDDLPLELQGKLLRVIQERQYERVGGEQTLTADLRIISASKSNLQSLVSQGKFRDDLMYRLRVLDLPLAPLRERMEDVPMLAKYFLDTLTIQRGISQKTLSFETLGRLMAHDWPGNVRELRHAMEYALAMGIGGEISSSDLPSNLGPAPKLQPPFKAVLDGFDKVDLRIMTEEFENNIIQWALKKNQGNQGKAADCLGIPRTTLQSKLRSAQGREAFPLPDDTTTL